MSNSASPLQPVGVLSETSVATSTGQRWRSALLRFGVFELDVTTGELRKEGRLIHLRLQPVNVLRLLLERSGELVTRREITAALWPDDLDVDVEQGLNHCMKEIRAALGDRPESPRFIQTLPRRGYRFLMAVTDTRRSETDAVPAAPRVHTEASANLVSAPETVRVRVLVTRGSDGALIWSEAREGLAADAQSLEREVLRVLESGLRTAIESAKNGTAESLEVPPVRRDRRFE